MKQLMTIFFVFTLFVNLNVLAGDDLVTINMSEMTCWTGILILSDDGQEMEMLGCAAESVVYAPMISDEDYKEGDEVTLVGKQTIKNEGGASKSMIIKIKDGKFQIPGTEIFIVPQKTGAPLFIGMEDGKEAINQTLYSVHKMSDYVTVHRKLTAFMQPDILNPTVTVERIKGRKITGKAWSIYSRARQIDQQPAFTPAD